MQTKQKHPFFALPVAAALLALTSVACNSNDYRTSNPSPSDSSTAVTNPASGATPAGQPVTTTPPKKVSTKKATAKIVVTEPMAGAIAPEFPGGQQALDNYVNNHIKYPQDAIDNDVTGIVRVSFIVDENGHITKAKLINPQRVGNGLDEEALRVVNNMPEWKPGTLHGKKVKTRLELPISFQVES
ncbi:MAG TPA: TonB family protein [Puia sp.]|uniref:energy transducer TonB n=1 Tax=Puia sp. TaxID=2045100 RepID=UPI002C501A3D|nr:TonB family protein [Puia sp.]HVU96274.1 TonB family protein [Puia sp.]